MDEREYKSSNTKIIIFREEIIAQNYAVGQVFRLNISIRKKSNTTQSDHFSEEINYYTFLI
jgi:hypothetical protein